jgi:methanogenic corrinoid protein MtbC1
MAEQKKVVKNLREKGFGKNVKIMVGGGPVTREYAKSIGADGYASTAPAAATLALTLVGPR